MSFIWPVMLLSLLLVPLLVAAYFWLLARRASQAAALGTMGLLRSRSGSVLGRRRHLPFLLFLLALTLLLLGVARPEMVVDLPRVEGTVILAFDVSNSMSADDLEPTRMEAAQAAARRFVENQPPTIRTGVVAFSSGGLIVQPPTDLKSDVLAAIERLSPEGDTSLGQGIYTSLNAIVGEPIAPDEAALEDPTLPSDIGHYGSSIIVLLTDGENTAPPDPREVAQLAADAGVRIFPVGIGSPEGTVLEIDGFNVATALDEAMLEEIAALTNGAYFYAADEAALQEIYDTIDLQLTIRGDKMEVTSLLAGLSMLLLLAGGALSMHWFGRIP